MNSARVILIGLLFFVPTISLAAPLYQPGETLNPACLPSDADCTVATSTASYFTATSTTATSTFPNLSLTNLLIGSDYLTDITGSGLSIVDGALTASGGAFATTTASYWINNVGNIGIGTSSPYTKLSVVGDIVATAITATSTFNTSGITGGYKIDGSLILQASTTNLSTLVGKTAGAALLSDGFYNTAVGEGALRLSTSSDNNTAVGSRALYSNTTGAGNTAFGTFSLYANTTATGNTGNGYATLYSNVKGLNNTASGYASMYSNTTGTNNNANGANSLYFNTTGLNNNASGYAALYANTTGTANTATGYASLYTNTTGTGNTADGSDSLRGNVTGSYNTGSGYLSLRYGSTTTGVTAIGFLSGVGATNAVNDYNSFADTYMTFLGASASRDSNVASTTVLTNATAIGYNAKVGGSNMLVLGNAANVGIGTSTPSSKLTITAPTPAITAHQMLTLYSNDAMAADKGGSIGFGGNYTTGGALAGWASIAGLKEDSTTGSLAGYLQFGTRSSAGTNAEVMRISSTGNVGIGTTTPRNKLEIVGTAVTGGSQCDTSNDLLCLQNSVSTGINIITPSTLVGAINFSDGTRAVGRFNYDHNLDAMSMWTGSTQRLTINSTGVGIGTTTPDKKFQVYDATTGASLNVRNAIGNGNGSTLLLGASRGTAATPTDVADGDSVGVFDSEAYSGGTWFSSAMMKSQVDGTFTSGQRPPSALTFYTNNANASRTEKLRITAGGNIGIGTTTPQATFEVGNSTNTVQRALFTNTNSGTAAYSEVGIRNGYGTSDDSLRLITFGTGWATSGRFIQDSALLEAAGNINGGLSISTAAAAPIRFYTTGNNERMRVDSGGNVGIGSSTPFAKLSVHANSGETNTTLFQIASSTASATTTLYSIDNAGNVFQGGGALQFGGSSPVLSALIYNGASTGSMSIRSGSASAVILNALNSSTAGRTAVSIFNSAVQSQSSGSNVGMVINPSYNQSGTAANTDLLINRTETALGSGAQYLFDAQVGGTSRFNITNAGNVGIGTSSPSSLLEIHGVSNNLKLTGTTPQMFFNETDVASDDFTLELVGGKLLFTETGIATRMVIDGSGFVGLGTTTPSARLSVTQNTNTPAGGLWIAETGNTDFRSAYMDTSGILSFYGGDTAGALNTATLNAAGAWTNASDKSYKENIVDLGTKYGLATVLQTQPRFYEMKGTHLPQVGFIAQELNELVPEVVDGKDGSMGISYGNLVAVAFQAIKELNTKVENMFKSLFVKELHIEEKLCVEEVCINKEQLKKLLLKAGAEEVKETPKENNDKPKDETPKDEVKEETATTTATTTPEVIKEEPKEEPKEEVKPQETASSTPEVVKEEEKPVEEKPTEEPKKEEVKEEVKSEEPAKIEEVKEEPKEEVKEEPKVETPNETQP